jgi:CheY-like chemotaxis protein
MPSSIRKRSSRASGTPQRHALVVEDSDAMATVLVAMLGRIGWQAEVAASALEALRLRHQHRFELIVADGLLRGRDGEPVVDDLIAEGGPAVVVLSNRADHPVADRGAVILARPFSLPMLEAAVAEALAGRAQAPGRQS